MSSAQWMQKRYQSGEKVRIALPMVCSASPDVLRISGKLTLNFMDCARIRCSTPSNGQKISGLEHVTGDFGPARNSVDQRSPRRIWRLLRDLQLLIT